MIYDVSIEKCITVINKNNKKETVSLEELMINLGEYKDICGVPQFDGLTEYAMYRFLCVLFTDIFPEKMEENIRDRYLQKLSEDDKRTIQKYFEDGRKNGWFNLLDKEKPFLHVPAEYADNLYKEPISVANITKYISSGDSPVLYGPSASEVKNISLAEYFYWTVYSATLAPAISGGFFGGCIKDASLFTLVKSENILATILLNGFSHNKKVDVCWKDYKLQKLMNNGDEGYHSFAIYPIDVYAPDLSSVDMKNKTIGRIYRGKNVFKDIRI